MSRILRFSNRAEWLRERRNGLGASDLRCLLGEGYAGESPLQLQLEKLGSIEPAAETDEERERWADAADAEEFGLRIFARKSGRRVARDKQPTIRLHRQFPEVPMFATLDGWAATSGEEGPAVVECKDVGLWAAADWRDDEAPLQHKIQVQAQLSVTGWDHGYLVGMVAGRPQIRRVERDEDFIASLEAFAAKWWRDHMIERIPAPPDASEATRRALLRLHPDDDGLAVRLDADISRIYRELRDLKAVAKQAEEQVALRENQIRAALGSHSFGLTDCGEWVSYRTVVRKGYTRVVEESKGRTLYLGYKSVPRDVEFVEDTAADALTAAG